MHVCYARTFIFVEMQINKMRGEREDVVSAFDTSMKSPPDRRNSVPPRCSESFFRFDVRMRRTRSGCECGCGETASITRHASVAATGRHQILRACRHLSARNRARYQRRVGTPAECSTIIITVRKRSCREGMPRVRSFLARPLASKRILQQVPMTFAREEVPARKPASDVRLLPDRHPFHPFVQLRVSSRHIIS